MPSQDKVMGAQELENFLKQQFPNSDKVNTLFEQIVKSKAEVEKEMREEDPFFYGTISRVIGAGSKNISDWVDNKGNVNTSRINNVIKVAKDDFVKRKRQEQENQQQQIVNESQTIEDIEKEQIKEQILNIDFDNLQIEDMITIAENFDAFVECSTVENINKYVDKVAYATSLNEEYSKMMKIYSAIKKGEKVSEEDEAWFNSRSPETLKKWGATRGNVNSIYNDKSKEIVDSVKDLAARIYSLGNIESEDLKQYAREILDSPAYRPLFEGTNPIIDKEQLRECIEDPEKLEEIFSNTGVAYNKHSARGPSTQQNNEKPPLLESYDRIRNPNENLPPIQSEQVASDDILQVDGLGLSQFAGYDAIIQQNEEFAKILMDATRDPVDLTPPDQVIDYTGWLDLQQQRFDKPQAETVHISAQDVAQIPGIENIFEQEITAEPTINDIVQPSIANPVSQLQSMAQTREDEPEDLANDYTYEIEEKKGIAGFFAGIGNSVRNFFQKRLGKSEEQKALTAGEQDIIKGEGLKVVTHSEGKGSLPSRNIASRFSIGLMDKITEAIQGIGKSKHEEQEVINKPETITTNKGDKAVEQTLEQSRLEQTQAIEQTQNTLTAPTLDQDNIIANNGKMDNNPWAVSTNDNAKKVATIATSVSKVAGDRAREQEGFGIGD